jgi:capsular polysaccharide biosynthesis protein
MIVELDEVAARVARSYWPLLLVMLVLPMLLVGMALTHGAPVYTAQTRLDASSRVSDAAPGDAGVSAVVSQVKAFATSYNVLAGVLRDQHIQRAPVKVAKKVQVNGLGTSTVVELSVSDPDPQVARRLTDALGVAVTAEINEANQGALNAQIARLDKQISNTQKQLGSASRRVVRDPLNVTAANEKDRLSSEVADLRADRTDLRGQLIGLVTGVLIAVMIETFRPTVPGPGRVARRLGVPLLGTIDKRSDRLADAGRRVRLAAKRNNVVQVVLVNTGRGPVPVDLVAKVAGAVYGSSSRTHERGFPTIAGLDDTASAAGDSNSTEETPRAVEARTAAEAGTDAGVDAGTDAGADAGGEAAGGHGGSDHEYRPGAARGNGSGSRSRRAGSPGTTIIRSGTSLIMKRSDQVMTVAERASARAVCHVHAIEDVDPGGDTDRVGVVAVAGPVTRAAALDAVRDLIAASGWPLLGVIATSRKTKGSART